MTKESQVKTARVRDGYILEVLKGMSLLTKEQQEIIVKLQNEKMLAVVKGLAKKDKNKFTAEQVTALEKAIKEDNGVLSFQTLAKNAGIKEENIPAIPDNLKIGKLAVEKKFVTQKDLDSALMTQAVARIQTVLEKGKEAFTESDAKGYVSEPEKQKDYIDPKKGPSQRIQTATLLTKVLCSAAKIGGPDVEGLPAVKEAMRAAGSLAYLYKKQAIDSLRKAGKKDQADALVKELDELKTYAPTIKERGDLEKSLWEKLVTGIKKICEKIGLKSLAGKLDHWLEGKQDEKLKGKYEQDLAKGTKEALGKVASKHNELGEKGITPEQAEKSKKWVDQQIKPVDRTTKVKAEKEKDNKSKGQGAARQ